MEREILKVDNDLCKLRACLDDTVPGVPIIHCEMKSWGKHESELFTFVWREFKSALKLMGFRGVCAVVPEDNTKLLKFKIGRAHV